MCNESVAYQLTGYKFNCITPFALKTKMTILFSHEITKLKPEFFFCGGGGLDVKLSKGLSSF